MLMLGFLVACAPAGQELGSGSASSGGMATPWPLPTLARPSAPPTSPTDALPLNVVAGRVTALTEGCVEVTTDDAVVWSLSGSPEGAVTVGETVALKVEPLAAGEQPCGGGRGARLVASPGRT